MMRLAYASLSLLVTLPLVACGGGGDDDDTTPTIDAGPGIDAATPDAAPPDPYGAYDPEPLAPGEISAAEQQALAERFNPAHVYTNPDHFATPLDYVLEQGTGLKSAPILSVGPYFMRLDLNNVADVNGIDLMNDDWSDLPLKDGMNRDLAYFIDTPGDATGPDYTDEDWTSQWMNAGGPTYPPTQYAHFFWLSKPDGYLAIQYWFFYPWNKFTNNHEGDWEHVNVIVKHDGSDYQLVMAHYSFHAHQVGLLAEDLVRVADEAGGPGNGDHIVVFVGGDACQVWGPGSPPFCGTASGASMPYPGIYTFASGVETIAGGTSIAGRPVHANDFTVVLLPREDEAVPAKLSWYKLPFFAGQPEVLQNAPVSISLNTHRAPLAPNHYHFEFETSVPDPQPDDLENATLEPFTPPGGWTMLSNPTTGF